MTTVGTIGAGDVGSHIARAAIASGYNLVIANARGPETLCSLIAQLAPQRVQPRPPMPPRLANSSWWRDVDDKSWRAIS